MSNVKRFEISENFSDNYYENELDYHKKGKTKIKNLSKTQFNVLEKVDKIPITNSSKENLSKLIINHKIKDIVKVLKVGRHSVTIHAKVDEKNKIFKNLRNTDDVIVKIYADVNRAETEMFSYSRNIHDEPKEVPTDSYPKWIEKDPNFLYESMILYQINNIVIMKMLNNSKTITQMIENRHESMVKMLSEILSLIIDVRERDYLFWSSELSTIKNIVWCKDKWVILNIVRKNHDLNVGKDKEKVLVKNYIELIELFKSFGMPIEDVERILLNNLKLQHYSFDQKIYAKLLDECLTNDGIRSKFEKGYMNLTNRYPRRRNQN